MKAAVMTDRETLEFESRPRPTPDANEVIIQVRDVGICGSDVHYYTDGRIGDFVVEDPLVLGHEVAGEIVQLGEDVSDLSIGQAVAIEPGVPCRACTYCKRGAYHLCEAITFMATPPDDGALVEYLAWPADFVYPLPGNVSTQEGALCEPLSVGIHACRRADLDVGDTVLITGCGPIGLLVMEVAFAFGAGDVIITDVIKEKLELATRRGATETVNVADRNLVDAIDDLTSGEGVDVGIEASGAPGVYSSLLSTVRRGGTITCLGLSSDREIPFDFVDLTVREITVNGSFRYANTYMAAVDLLARNVVDVDGIIDETIPFEEIVKAFETSRKPNVVKTMVSF